MLGAWSFLLRNGRTLRDFELPEDWSNWGSLSIAANLEPIHEVVLTDPQKQTFHLKENTTTKTYIGEATSGLWSSEGTGLVGTCWKYRRTTRLASAKMESRWRRRCALQHWFVMCIGNHSNILVLWCTVVISMLSAKRTRIEVVDSITSTSVMQQLKDFKFKRSKRSVQWWILVQYFCKVSVLCN